mmetsp:Transcript_6078/g.9318  ORF Transcript_6078/g.9318 Transcript_6078/m.9318 type:complete len:471 (+) Transcript_6078:282-1694(+)
MELACGSSRPCGIQEEQLPQHYNPQPKGIVVTLLLIAMATMAFIFNIQNVTEGERTERHLVEPPRPVAMRLDPSLRLAVFSSGKSVGSYPDRLASSPVKRFDTMTFQHYGLCLNSVLKEEQVFDVILMEFDLSESNEGFQTLVRKLQARYPYAIIIIICDWAAPWNFRRRNNDHSLPSPSFVDWSNAIGDQNARAALEKDVTGDWYHVHHHPQDDIVQSLVKELPTVRLYSVPLVGKTGRDSLLAYLSYYNVDGTKSRSTEGHVALSDALYFEVQSAMLEGHYLEPADLVQKGNSNNQHAKDEEDFCHYWYWNGNETVVRVSDNMSSNWNLKEDPEQHSFGLEFESSTGVAWIVLTNPLMVHADLYFSHMTYTEENNNNPPTVTVEVRSIPDGILMQRHLLETVAVRESQNKIRTVLGGENLPPQVAINITFTATESNLPFEMVGYVYSQRETPLEWGFGSFNSLSRSIQ